MLHGTSEPYTHADSFVAAGWRLVSLLGILCHACTRMRSVSDVEYGLQGHWVHLALAGADAKHYYMGLGNPNFPQL